ncbi:MAG: hypothetical protein IJ388_03035 [Oscillospiraceae bacterium]|nr:hypothetical protein [Oscillospiraceae bacterium]
MSGCKNCSGNCQSCSGCSGALTLTEGEISILQQLGQIPFLPVARKADDMTPICPECPSEEHSLILQCLEKKQLISIDYDAPLKGCDNAAYGNYPVRGSFALTARGQQVLELLEIQGAQ